MTSCQLDIPPFALPSPFMRARDYPASIVIKPSKGSFLTDYSNKSNLHIAVTDSRGQVVEFDQSGLRRGGISQSGARTDWSQCLVVNLGESDPGVADMIGGEFEKYQKKKFLNIFFQLTQTGASTGTCVWSPL